MMKVAKDSHLRCWLMRLKSWLEIAQRDILTCLHCYGENMRSTPMTYVILSNKTKDGYALTDLLLRTDKTMKTQMEFKEEMPFVQMARLFQVSYC